MAAQQTHREATAPDSSSGTRVAGVGRGLGWKLFSVAFVAGIARALELLTAAK